MNKFVDAKKLFFAFIFIVSNSHFIAQFDSYRLINIDLIGINSNPRIKNLSRIQRYFEKSGIRLNIDFNQSIKMDTLKIPTLDNSNSPNFLMRELIKDYQLKNNEIKPNNFIIFCVPEVKRIYNFQGFQNFGFGFCNANSQIDNNILGCIATSLGVEHIPDTAFFLENQTTINSFKLSKVNYRYDVSVYDKFQETGLTAFFIWEEDQNGIIAYDPKNPLKSIIRSKKENFGLKYLNPDNWLFKPFFVILGEKICPAHVIVFIVSLIIIILFFRLIKKITYQKKWTIKFSGFLVRLLVLFFSIVLIGMSFWIINSYYINHYVIETEITEFDDGVTAGNILKKVKDDLLFEIDSSNQLNTQIFRKKNNTWYIQRNAPVLIFQLNEHNELKFKEGSESVTFRGDTIFHKVRDHFIKIEHTTKFGEVLSERIYNYNGEELYSTNLQSKIIGRRIVLFVNGYRAPFLSEEDFSRTVLLKRMLENRTEIDKTSNKIFNFDLFEYWNQWNRFDDRFILKLQPHDVYYADGHHPIKTSNYGLSNLPFQTSLINNLGDLSYFYFAASNFPSICGDLNKHHCKYVDIPHIGVKNTWELLPSDINYKGFNERRESGTIAGKNLLQLMNGDDKGTYSQDTIFIVCHSMGFAYAQGIIESLRGKINFGGYYIFSPENPAAGRVNPSEWEEVWQYGSNEQIAECLQDGIAPQSSIKGLEKNRAFFPKEYYSKLGFTGSHFIGNFIWVFDLLYPQSGSITRH